MRQIKITRHETGRHTHKSGTILLVVVLVLFLLAILGFVGVTVFRNVGVKRLHSSATSRGPVLTFDEEEQRTPAAGNPEGTIVVQAPEEDPESRWEEGWIRYNGKIYEYNENLLTFLALGIDEEGPVKKNKDLVSGGQADTIFLAVANPDTKELSLIGINRDTMVDVNFVGLGPNGSDITATAQLAAQHGYGDGMQQSCELMRDAVSTLFYELPIHGYISMNWGGVTALNDTVGGVKVTIQEDMTKCNPNWKKGTSVTLKGADVYSYVRWRDTTVFESSRNRLERQKNYLSSLSSKMMEKVKKDVTLPLTLYKKFSKYIVTDVTLDEISYLAGEVINYSFSTDRIYTLEGTTQMGEKYEEFYPDQQALKELMLQVFYKEVDLDAID